MFFISRIDGRKLMAARFEIDHAMISSFQSPAILAVSKFPLTNRDEIFNNKEVQKKAVE